MNKYFVFDVDGTLAKKKNKVHKKNIDAIKHLRSNGAKMVIATGRQPSSTMKISSCIEGEKHLDYGISFNGGVLWKYKEGNQIEIIYEKKIDNKLAKEIFDLSNDLGLISFGYTDTGELLTNAPSSVSAKFMSKRTKLKLLKYNGSLECSIYKFISMGKSKKVNDLINFSKENKLSVFDFSYIPGTKNIEVCPPDTNKVNGLKKIAEIEKLSSKDFIYFGDGDNDSEALKWVEHSVAMKNARNDVKEVSKYQTDKSNKKGGVGHYLYKEFINK